MTATLPSRGNVLVRLSGPVADVALAAVTVVVFTAVALATGVRNPWEGALPLALFLGVLLFLRRRWPMAVLLLSVAGIVVYHHFHWSPAGWIWPVAAAYFTAATAPRMVRWVALVGAAQIVYSAVHAGPIVDRNLSRYVVHVLGESVLLAVLIGGGVTYAAVLRWRAGARETEGRARVAEERLRVAREVHDIVAHTLAVVGVHLNVAADTLREEPAEAAAALAVAKEVRARAMQDLTALIGVLRDAPEATVPQPGLDALDTLVADARATGMDVTFTEQGERSAVPATAAVAVHRIVQESLANTLRHGGAGRVRITVGYGPEAVTLEIADDGEPGPVAGDGHGLTGMRERVGALGGELTAGPVDGGYAVRATIPVAGSAA
ncbi:sensor histidine kinase [Herbidospora cretacea]|uniref:sensor histidine kinase n=1 Tax=Herbidospora cretacea TaxID=28444 RepID=UPI00068FE8F6|nr:histidine kinase [Herbidospora cretacea]